MTKTDFSRLEFFSKHFNVPEEKLKWCILEDVTNPECHYFFLGLAISGSKYVVSVEQCCLRRLQRGKLKLHAATLKETSKKFILKSEKPIYRGQFIARQFTRKRLADLYCDKWYDNLK